MVELTLYSLGSWLALIFMSMLAVIAPVIVVLENRQQKKRKDTSIGQFTEMGSGIYYFIRGGNQK